MQICYNGSFQPASGPTLRVSNRSYRYGDGLIESMLYRKGILPLENYHFIRLFKGLDLLGLRKNFTKEILRENISILCGMNQCNTLARVRLSVYGGEGIISERGLAGYVIEATALEPEYVLYNSKGLHIGIYSGAHKSCDAFSNLKSSSALPYVMAAQHANGLEWDDCLVLNSKGTLADSSIANLFIIRDHKVITPPLTDGCVNGVMRKFLIDHFSQWATLRHYELVERSITPGELEIADEIFLTNAIRGVQWVNRFAEKTYGHPVTSEISSSLLQAIPV